MFFTRIKRAKRALAYERAIASIKWGRVITDILQNKSHVVLSQAQYVITLLLFLENF